MYYVKWLPIRNALIVCPFIIKEHEMTKLRPTNYFTEKQHWCRTFKIGKGLDSQLIFPESRNQGTDGERGNGNV